MTLWDGFPAGEGCTHLSLCPRGRALLCVSGDYSSPSWRQTGCSPGNKAPELPAGSIRRTFFSFFMADICTNTACPFWSHSPRTSIWMLSSPAHLPDGSPYTPVSGSVWFGSQVSLKSVGAWRRKPIPFLALRRQNCILMTLRAGYAGTRALGPHGVRTSTLVGAFLSPLSPHLPSTRLCKAPGTTRKPIGTLGLRESGSLA